MTEYILRFVLFAGIGAAGGYALSRAVCKGGACPIARNAMLMGVLGGLLGILAGYAVGAFGPSTDAPPLRELRSAEQFGAALASAEGPVIVEFGSPTCPPCRVLEPTLRNLQRDWQGRAAVYKVDVSAAPELARNYGIEATPTLIYFRDGEELGRTLGLRTHGELDEILQHLAHAEPESAPAEQADAPAP